MTPLTPFIENRTGRLTELVYLLADRPLTLAHQAVLDAEEDQGGGGDPWHIVASALHRLQTLDESILHSRYLQQELERANAAASATVTATPGGRPVAPILAGAA